MNQIILFEKDFIAQSTVQITDRRFDHIKEFLTVQSNSTLKVGLLNNKQGTGQVKVITDIGITLDVKLDQDPPESLALRLILALPRPKMFRRILQCVTALGVKEIYLIRTWRVDNSYWDSPLLTEVKLNEIMVEGLEQAVDTQMPSVYMRPLFKPFVEDELPALVKASRALIAHPYAVKECPRDVAEHVTLAVGPEGGFLQYEIEKLQECGFDPVTLFDRILKVEHAVPVLIGRLK